MAIIQISRIQHRMGPLAELPTYLEAAEFGWTTDERRLFIGNRVTDGAPIDENVEIITSYSLENQRTHNITLLDSTTGGLIMSFAEVGKNAINVSYSLLQNNLARIGKLNIVGDGTNQLISDDFDQTGTTEILFTVSKSIKVLGTVGINSATAPVPGVTIGDDLQINSQTITFTGTSLQSIAADITGNGTLAGLNISAEVEKFKDFYFLTIRRTNLAGNIVVAEGTSDQALTNLGLMAGTYTNRYIELRYTNSSLTNDASMNYSYQSWMNA